SNGTVAAAGDFTGEIASTLNSGLTSPSTDIYAYYQGTSMATPHVSGVAALVKSVQPSITPAALTALLRSTSTPFAAGSTCTTALCGTGILDAANAVTAAAAVGPRTLGAFSKASPAAGTIGTVLAPTLTWAASTGASAYEYCVVAGVATPCTTWISTGAATSVALSGLGSNTLYSWQVRAIDAAGTATAEANVSLRYTFTTGAVAGALAKTAPANAATGIATTRLLTWGASTGATSYEYCIDLVVNNTCDATWVSTGVTRSATVGPLLGSTRYEWQVRARNTIGVVAANANVAWTFTTLVPPLPGAFAKTSPTSNQTARPLALTLSWGASTSTTSYQYCVDTVNNNLCDTAWVSTGTTRTAAITGLTAKTPYYWQVRAIGAGGTTLANAGTWWLFTTA
ncbi:MAG: S8 family serine peptidase, partial [Actinomycetota bacterium]